MKAVVESRGQKIVFDNATRDHIRDVARWLINPKGKPGIMLRGLYGNGKTTLLKALKWLIEFATEETLGYNDRKTVKFMTAKEIASLCSVEESRKRYRALFSEPMLAIDDFGEEPAECLIYGMPLNPMTDLLLHRYDRQLMTVVSTNLTSEEIGKKYGGRIRDRLKEMMETVNFENQSYRR